MAGTDLGMPFVSLVTVCGSKLGVYPVISIRGGSGFASVVSIWNRRDNLENIGISFKIDIALTESFFTLLPSFFAKSGVRLSTLALKIKESSKHAISVILLIPLLRRFVTLTLFKCVAYAYVVRPRYKES